MKQVFMEQEHKGFIKTVSLRQLSDRIANVTLDKMPCWLLENFQLSFK